MVKRQSPPTGMITFLFTDIEGSSVGPREIAEVKRLLGTARLVTLTG